MILEAFYRVIIRRHDLTWPKDKDNDKNNIKDKDNPRDVWLLRHWLQFCKWESEFMTFFVTWQTRQHSQFLRASNPNCFLDSPELVWKRVKMRKAFNGFDWGWKVGSEPMTGVGPPIRQNFPRHPASLPALYFMVKNFSGNLHRNYD